MNDRDCESCVHHTGGSCSVWECSYEPIEDDTISRLATIGALCGWCQANCIPCESFPCGEIKVLQTLTSAQQERLTDDDFEIIPTQTGTSNTLKALDCVERQAAIDEIENYPHGCTWNVESMKDMTDRIKALPSAQQWILCSERPPEEDERVFVYLFDDSPYIAWFCGGRWHTEEFTLDKDEGPAAWMPLPKPYKEEE